MTPPRQQITPPATSELPLGGHVVTRWRCRVNRRRLTGAVLWLRDLCATTKRFWSADRMRSTQSGSAAHSSRPQQPSSLDAGDQWERVLARLLTCCWPCSSPSARSGGRASPPAPSWPSPSTPPPSPWRPSLSRRQRQIIDADKCDRRREKPVKLQYVLERKSHFTAAVVVLKRNQRDLTGLTLPPSPVGRSRLT